MNRDSWQAARAVFLAAIMVISVFAAGIAFSGSAAADRSSAIQGPASDGVLTVAADGSAEFETIQAAIDHGDSSDIVRVESGTYDESVTIDTEGLTLQGADGASPTIIGQSSTTVTSTAPNVEIADLRIKNPDGSRAVRVTDNATGVVIQNNTVANVNTNNNADQPRGIVVGGLDGGDSADGLEIRNNTVTNVEGGAADEDQAHAIQILEESSGGGLIENVVVDGNTIESITDTRSTVAVNFNGKIEGEITNNDISGLNTEGNPDDVDPGGGFTQVIALTKGGNAADGPQNVAIEGNDISDIETTAPEEAINFAPPRHIHIGEDADAETISIENNDFSADSVDPRGDVYVGGNTGGLNLDAILNDQGNTFDRAVAIENETGTLQTGIGSSVQFAVDQASPGDTISVGPGTFNESVTIDTEDVTVEGPNAGIAGDSDQRGDESIITSGLTIAADGVTIDGVQIENADRDGIRFGPDTVPSNVTIQNSVVTNVTGDTGGKAAANGIQFFFGGVANETAKNVRILDNEISDISAPDTGQNESDAIGVNVLPRGNDIVNLRIAGNTIENISVGDSSGRSEARGISIGTQFENTSDGSRGNFGQAIGLTVENNNISNLESDFTRAIALFEDKKGAAKTSDKPVGPVNFTIIGNNISGVNSEANFFDAAIFIGEYGNFGNGHIVQNNNFTGATVQNFNDSDALNTTGNTFSGDPKGDIHYTAADADVDSIINSNTFNRRVTIRDASGNVTGDTIFAGIQPAIDGVPPAVDAISSGETVVVRPGTFNESVTITTQNITLVGPNADTPGDASRGDEAIVEGQINVNAQNVTIDGLQVTPGVDTFNETPAAAIIVYEPNATIRNNKVADFTINVTDISANSVQGIQIFEAGTELTGIEITNNSVENITYAGSSQAPNGSWGTDYGNLYGIHVQGEIGNAEIAGNTLQNLSSDGYTLAMAVSGTDSDPDASPDDIVIGGNTFANLNAKGAPATAFTVSSDRVNASNVSVVENSFDAPVDIDNKASETLEAPLNYYGDGDTPTIEGSVIYDPLLTVPIEQANLENPQEVRSYGSYLELDTEGEPAVIGFPAPPAEPLGELIPNETLSVAGEGAQVFLYDSAEQSFEEVNGSFVPDAGDVIVITTGGDALSGEIIVPVDTTVAGNAATPDSGTVDINEGWNLVATGAADGLTSPTATSDIVDAGQFQIQPDQPGAPGVTVGAYEGTWLFAESSGELTTGYRGDQPPSGYIDRVLIPEDDNKVN